MTLPEIRHGFVVSEKRKRIWAVQLSLLSEIDRICRKYGFRYFAANGTLLGAVKYGGFIPWDDDMDVAMPRPDYDKFVEATASEVKAPVYFQDARTSSGYFRGWGRLRHAETTAVPWIDIDRSHVNGIFVDIFPVDGYCERDFGRQWNEIRLWYGLAYAVVYPNRSSVAGRLKAMAAKGACKFLSYQWIVNRLNRAMSRHGYARSERVFYLTHNKPIILNAQDIEPLETLPFEGGGIPAPNGYPRLLAQLYGDYMRETPPTDERGKRHQIFMDPDKPYSEYYGKLSRAEFLSLVNNY